MSSKGKVVVLDRGEYTTCSVNLHGGNVTSWRVSNKEQIFVSRQAQYNDQTFIRGGIAIVFPRVNAWEFGPENGFSRLMQWTVEKPPKKLPTDDIEATFSLSENEYSKAMWNYRFKILNKITLQEKQLLFDITVKNTDKNFSFNFEIMTHTHIKVPDVTKCEVVGLKGCEYREITFINPQKSIQQKDHVTFNEYVNRCYENTPDDIFLTKTMQDQIINVRKNNFSELVIWNPWEEQSKTLESFDTDEYMKMTTIEAARVKKPVHLEPGEEFHGNLELEICPSDYCKFDIASNMFKFNK